MLEKYVIRMYAHNRREPYGMRDHVAKQDDSSDGLFPFLI